MRVEKEEINGEVMAVFTPYSETNPAPDRKSVV